jgi:hypothetical protein
MWAILLPWLLKLLPAVLGLLGKMFVDFLTNLAESQGGASDPKIGAELAKKLAPLADKVVNDVEALSIADSTEKRDTAVELLKRDALDIGIELATAAANTAIELAVQRLKSG